MSRPDRLHIALGLLVALGVGWRAMDADARPGTQSELNEQIARVDKVRGDERAARSSGGAPSPSAPKRTSAKRDTPPAPRAKKVVERTGSVAITTQSGMRSEVTPLSVVAPGGLKYVRTPVETVGGAKPGIVVDVDGAGVRELDALPGVGPALAKRIFDERAKGGPFRDLQGLQRVKGIGPKLAARLALYVTFGPTGRPLTVMPRVLP